LQTLACTGALNKRSASVSEAHPGRLECFALMAVLQIIMMLLLLYNAVTKTLLDVYEYVTCPQWHGRHMQQVSAQVIALSWHVYPCCWSSGHMGISRPPLKIIAVSGCVWARGRSLRGACACTGAGGRWQSCDASACHLGNGHVQTFNHPAKRSIVLCGGTPWPKLRGRGARPR
jgi:hypothetical protein